MKINFIRMNNVIKSDRSTELLTPALRTDLAWLSKEYRRIANVLKTKTDLTSAERCELANVKIDTSNFFIVSFKEQSISDLIENAICLAEMYLIRASESNSNRGQRRAYSRTGIEAERWDMTELDPEFK